MSRTFKLTRCPHESGLRMFQKSTFEFEPGITMLVGCNGSGKSTLIRLLEQNLNKNGILYFDVDQVRDDRHFAFGRFLQSGKTEYAASLLTASEGEGSIISLGSSASEIGNFVRKHTDEKELWFFFDGVDSGMDINSMQLFNDLLLHTILDDCASRGINAYIICATNAYEMTRENRCLDVVRNRYIEFSSYEDYVDFICRSTKLKEKRDDKIKNIKGD